MPTNRNEISIAINFGNTVVYHEKSSNDVDIDAAYLLLPEMLSDAKKWLNKQISNRVDEIQSSGYDVNQTSLPIGAEE